MSWGMTEAKQPGEASPGLFADLPPVDERQAAAQAQARAASKREGAPRLRQPNRAQIELRASDLESLLGEDHRARLVWGFVERQDLRRLTHAIKARGSNARRAAIDPRILPDARTVLLRVLRLRSSRSWPTGRH